MSDEQGRPEWVFAEQKKRTDKGQIWLIVGLVVFALLLIGALLFFLIPRDDEPGSAPAPTETAESTQSPPSTSSPSAEPTEGAQTDPPPVPEPDLETFKAQVQPRLDDATRGLDLVAQNLDLGAQIVESLQNDANILSDTPAPSSIAEGWSTAVAEYASKLAEVRATYDDGSDPQPALDAASTALQEVRALVGL